MAYEPVNPGDHVETAAGDIQVTVSLDMPLYTGQTLKLLRTVPRFESNPARTPIEVVPDNGGGPLVYTFTILGTSIFGDSLEDLDQTDTEITFTPNIYEGVTNVSSGDSFSVWVKKVFIPEAPLDIPVTDGLFKLWDSRFRVDIPNGTWNDRIENSAINLYNDTGQEFYEMGVSDETSRFKVVGLGTTNNGSGNHVGHIADGIFLPETWTMFVIGYSMHDSDYGDVAEGQHADALLGYEGADAMGPYEGIYKRAGMGTVASSGNMNIAFDVHNLHSYVVRSKTANPVVDVYIDGNNQGGIAFNTSTVGGGQPLRYLFPTSPWARNDYRLGVIAFFDRDLTETEIEDLSDYAYDVWYESEN